MNIVQKQIKKWTSYKPKNYNSYWRQKIHRLSDHVGILLLGASILALTIGFAIHD